MVEPPVDAVEPDNDPHFSVATVSLDGEARLIVHGEVDLAARDSLTRAVRKATASTRRVTVDLRDVSFLDASGIGVFAGAVVDGSDVSLLNPQPRIRHTLEITGVDEYIPIVSGDKQELNQ